MTDQYLFLKLPKNSKQTQLLENLLSYFEKIISKKKKFCENYSEKIIECLDEYKTDTPKYYYELFDRTIDLVLENKLKINIEKAIKKIFDKIPEKEKYQKININYRYNHRELFYKSHYKEIKIKNITLKKKELKKLALKKHYKEFFDESFKILE